MLDDLLLTLGIVMSAGPVETSEMGCGDQGRIPAVDRRIDRLAGRVQRAARCARRIRDPHPDPGEQGQGILVPGFCKSVERSRRLVCAVLAQEYMRQANPCFRQARIHFEAVPERRFGVVQCTRRFRRNAEIVPDVDIFWVEASGFLQFTDRVGSGPLGQQCHTEMMPDDGAVRALYEDGSVAVDRVLQHAGLVELPAPGEIPRKIPRGDILVREIRSVPAHPLTKRN